MTTKLDALLFYIITRVFKGVLGTRFRSLESQKIINGSLKSENRFPIGSDNRVPTDPHRVPNIFLKKLFDPISQHKLLKRLCAFKKNTETINQFENAQKVENAQPLIDH